jgi:hypothetical protein
LVKWSILCVLPLLLVGGCGTPASPGRPSAQAVAHFTNAVTGEPSWLLRPEVRQRLVRIGEAYCSALTALERDHMSVNTNKVFDLMDVPSRSSGLAVTASVPARRFLCPRVGKVADMLSAEGSQAP